MYGRVGIYVSNNISKVHTVDNIALTKTCCCSKCEMESLFRKVSYMNNGYVIGGIYRHPNGTVNHFINDLEAALNKIDNKMTTVIVGDMNIDIIKFENDNSVNYLTRFIITCHLSPCQRELHIFLLHVLNIYLSRYQATENQNLMG